jgi:hypothetical protein
VTKEKSLIILTPSSQDLYVGAIVTFNKHTFLLTSADEYVFSYMERPNEREKVGCYVYPVGYLSTLTLKLGSSN